MSRWMALSGRVIPVRSRPRYVIASPIQRIEGISLGCGCKATAVWYWRNTFPYLPMNFEVWILFVLSFILIIPESNSFLHSLFTHHLRGASLRGNSQRKELQFNAMIHYTVVRESSTQRIFYQSFSLCNANSAGSLALWTFLCRIYAEWAN